MIPLARPQLGKTEARAVQEVLESGMLVQGQRVSAFECELALRAGREFAVAVSSGTSALLLGLQALGVGAGDEVLCPALSWPSPAHAIRLLGATPVLVDVDPEDWNGAPEAYAEARSSRTKLALVIDQFGNPVRRAELDDVVGDLPVVEDAACALGSHFEDAPCGSFGVLSTLSFHPRKLLTTGEGGACLTDDAELAARLRALRNHGQSAPGEFLEAAGNHRMTEIAAAIGLCQLARLDAMLDQRAKLAERYVAALEALALDLRVQRSPRGVRSNRQTMAVWLPDSAPPRPEVMQRMRDLGVGAGILSYSLARLPHLLCPAETPVADALADRGLALPLFEGMSAQEVDQVVEALKQALTQS
ncbi:MAG: DegT/DnrJ/EryC1/StrS aminotransferase family protein [Deltaproteobacteria bacterium]|nr:DegT/DnrJ/EryC1/StrS aminotransferase family protein [Deltaproteobacteria bacterium]